MLQESAKAMPEIIEVSGPDRDDVFMKPAELAARWRTDVGTLANLRSRGEGLPFVKLPSGPILYKVADVLAAEAAGARGFMWSKLAAAIRAFPGISGDQADDLIKHLERELRR
jgi:hypothetical protein